MKRYLIWIAFVLLLILHHDWWLWDSGYLLFGFLPAGLAYHALISILAGALWALAVVYAWPADIDKESKPDGGEGGES
jgi:hypothetical protein